ncbi:acyl carrier protein [Rhodococcus sp. MTM3W5.2]|uniref:acyl carrier protein n=1 Tax=Rhodococcus sp. MTM3W5.2 TaxID=1805827 RepID=UPI001CB8E623|nr:acyl carrier protein [Rhodococcus sp. MTM3W5.2]
MNQDALENEIVGLLAANMSRNADELDAELRALGQEMPVDSLLSVELIVELEMRYGITIPINEDTADALRSVRLFAQLVGELIPAQRNSEESA